jgi:hypothetical protein
MEQKPKIKYIKIKKIKFKKYQQFRKIKEISLDIYNQKNIEKKNCIICFNKIDFKDKHYLHCGHCFHCNCIKIWTNQKEICPICRSKNKCKNILESNEIVLNEDFFISNDNNENDLMKDFIIIFLVGISLLISIIHIIFMKKMFIYNHNN